jgi:arylsulfatase
VQNSSADEGVDVGMDNETMVSNDYKPGENKFTGKIVNVTINTAPTNLSTADTKAVKESIELAAEGAD